MTKLESIINDLEFINEHIIANELNYTATVINNISEENYRHIMKGIMEKLLIERDKEILRNFPKFKV